eukprot:1688712-Amphidinium_carterae.1
MQRYVLGRQREYLLPANRGFLLLSKAPQQSRRQCYTMPHKGLEAIRHKVKPGHNCSDGDSEIIKPSWQLLGNGFGLNGMPSSKNNTRTNTTTQ